MRISDWSSDVCSSDLEDEDGHLDEGADDRSEGDGRGEAEGGDRDRNREFEIIARGGESDRGRAWIVCLDELAHPEADQELDDEIDGQRDGDPDDVARYGRSRRSEEHTSELQSLMRISYAVFCLKKKNRYPNVNTIKMSPERIPIQ